MPQIFYTIINEYELGALKNIDLGIENKLYPRYKSPFVIQNIFHMTLSLK